MTISASTAVAALAVTLTTEFTAALTKQTAAGVRHAGAVSSLADRANAIRAESERRQRTGVRVNAPNSGVDVQHAQALAEALACTTAEAADYRAFIVATTDIARHALAGLELAARALDDLENQRTERAEAAAAAEAEAQRKTDAEAADKARRNAEQAEAMRAYRAIRGPEEW